MADKKIGTITHFYDNISVGIVKLEEPLEKGQKIAIRGNTTDFEQTAESMQFDHKDIEKAKAGQEVGLKVDQKVREGDKVFLAE